MAYSGFTLKKVKDQFKLTVIENVNLFRDQNIQPFEISDFWHCRLIQKNQDLNGLLRQFCSNSRNGLVKKLVYFLEKDWMLIQRWVWMDIVII